MTAPSSDRRRGAALFVVLTFAALLAELAATAMRDGMSGARAAQAFVDVARADELGRSAADILIYHLVSGGDEAKRGGALAVHLADADIRISYVSASSCIDVNAAPVGLIAALLAAAGAEPQEVAAITERITQFRAEARGRKTQAGVLTLDPQLPNPSGANGAPALAMGAPETPPTAIQVTTEILADWGLPPGLARKILPALTAASGSPKVDPVLAGRPVLLALFGNDEARVDDYIERRARGFTDAGSALAPLPVPAQAYAGFDDAAAVHALALVTVAGHLQRRYDMVLALPAGLGRVPVVVSWRKLL